MVIEQLGALLRAAALRRDVGDVEGFEAALGEQQPRVGVVASAASSSTNEPRGTKRAVVTGANAGLGYAAALALANRGASVVCVCRNASRGEAAVSAIKAETYRKYKAERKQS